MDLCCTIDRLFLCRRRDAMLEQFFACLLRHLFLACNPPAHPFYPGEECAFVLILVTNSRGSGKLHKKVDHGCGKRSPHEKDDEQEQSCGLVTETV